MRKTTRLFALVLLLASVVSVFAVLPAFAADASSDIVTVFDQNAGIGGTTYNDNYSSAATSSAATAYAANDVKYTKITWNKGYSVAGTKYVAQPFYQMVPDRTKDSGLYFHDGYNASGNAVKDAVDYIVIDMDIGTETNAHNMIQFQTRFYYYTSAKKNTSAQYYHPRLNGDAGSNNVYFNFQKSNGTPQYATSVLEPSETEWAHVTLVYDVSKGTTGSTKDNRVHVYYNGNYVSTQQGMTSSATYINQFRLLVGETSVAPDMDNESVSFANFTIKYFKAGYSGDIATNLDKLGNANYPLSYFSDLAYCYENLPVNNIATIQRGDETIEVTSINDLDCTLQSGDKVTLLRDITRPIVVPEGVEFVLGNYHMVDPIILSDYEDLDWIIRDQDGQILTFGDESTGIQEAKGAQVYDDTNTLVTDTLQAFIDNYYVDEGSGKKYCKLPAEAITITLLNDIEVSNTSNHSIAVPKNGKLIYDLRDNTLTVNSLGAHYLRPIDDTAIVVVKNGNITHSDSANNLVFLNVGAKVYFRGATIDSSGAATVLDQRKGNFFLYDSTMNLYAASLSVKSYNGGVSYFVMDNSTITSTSKEDVALSLASTSSGKPAEGEGRYGGMQNNVVVFGNSNINAVTKAIHVVVYANEHDKPSGVSASNQNYSKIEIRDSKITAEDAIAYTLDSLYSAYVGNVKTFAFATDLASTNTLNISASEINSNRFIVKTDKDAYDKAVNAFKDVEGVDVNAYTFTVTANIADSKIKANGNLINDTSVRPGITINGDDVKLAMTQLVADGQVLPTVVPAAGQQFAYSSDAEYNFEVTANCTPFTYKLGDADVENFYWVNPAEGVAEPDISRVVTLDTGVANLYHYEWLEQPVDADYQAILVKDFKFSTKTNLTLIDEIYLNVFINKAQYDAIKDYVTIGGAVLDTDADVAIDGVEYYKLQNKNADITDPTDCAISITLEFNTKHETYTKTANYDILTYANNMLGKESTTGDSRTLIEAVLNYIATAQEVAGIDASATRENITESFAAPEVAEVEGSIPGVSVAMTYGQSISWAIAADTDMTVQISYTYNGENITYTKALKAGQAYIIKTKAYDFANGITVTVGENQATMTPGAYYGCVSEANDKAMVAAIYNYAKAANAYVNPYKTAN